MDYLIEEIKEMEKSHLKKHPVILKAEEASLQA